VAAAQRKLSIAYGAEAGKMDWVLQAMCRRYCADSLVIARTLDSQHIVESYGVTNVKLGTDTAWTFEPHAPDVGTRELKQAGGATAIAAHRVSDKSVLVAGEGVADETAAWAIAGA
jgi:polysaccharide pyruvyl transferase WcaK-like protein